MPQRRKLATNAAPVDTIRKELLKKLADVLPARRHQDPFPFLEKLRELSYVGGIGRYRQPCQSLLDPQVVEKPREHARIGLRSHTGKEFDYARYRTLRKVTNQVPDKAA